MSSGNTNNKSAKKNIRFPHELIDGIDASVEQEKLTNPSANFSAWVLLPVNANQKTTAPQGQRAGVTTTSAVV
ncbi:YlcI/YnfO family protein [Escherichia coli]|uniref:YlcI/YnfO family protein n=1 Tax=Escherichia coli TaxID=562 RepID=UPI00050AEE2A|nr:YlcI/YnfO family protein [Escherichia coli]